MASKTIQKKPASRKAAGGKTGQTTAAAPVRTVTQATLTRKLADLAAAKRLAAAVSKAKTTAAAAGVVPVAVPAASPVPPPSEATTKPVEVAFIYSLENRTQIPERVFIAGDFNDWNPQQHPLQMFDGGVYRAVLRLAPGTYQYKFVVDGEWTHDPRAELHAGNDHGTLNSVVRV